MQKSYNSGGNNRQFNRAPHKRRSSRPVPRALPASRFINKAIKMADEIAYVPEHQFTDFALGEGIQANLAFHNYTTPSPIQDQTIPMALEGKDVIGLANTGTGKTAAFLLPIIEKLRVDRKEVSVLIMAPTRELAQQIEGEFRKFSAGGRMFSTLVVGGANIGRQINAIKRGPHVIIGTPGRLRDLIDRKVLRLSNVSTFVLDEADRMCDMGFVNDIRSIASELQPQRQTLCFSATMTRDVQTIVEEFMINPVTVSVAKQATNDHIEQDVVHTRGKEHKVEVLHDLLQREDFAKVLIFGETKFGVQRLADKLSQSNLPASAIHGNKSQSQREKALRDFKSGSVNIMVATDVAARGLDIPDVSHVINFDAPTQYEDYVHRIGRTGRAGKAGTALTFVDEFRQNY